MWTFEVNSLRVGFDDVGGYVACNLEHLLVVLDSVVEVNGSVGILILISEVALFEFDYSFHFRVIQIEFKFRMVTIIVCHDCVFIFGELRS